MKQNYLHLLVDSLLLLGAVSLILTGLLLKFVLPPGSGQASVWELTRHEWGNVHFWIAVGMLAMGLLHLLLNWGWVCSVCAKLMGLESTKPTIRRKLITGTVAILTLAVLIGGFFLAANAYKIDHAQGQGGQGQGPAGRHDVEQGRGRIGR